MVSFAITCLHFRGITKLKSITWYEITKLTVSVKKIKNSTGVLTFLVLVKRSGTKNIENHKLFLIFLAPIAKLSWM